jgi:hypothetical protein
MIGYPKVTCSVNVRTVQAFGNNFAGPQFGATRFGTFTNCAPPTRKDQCKKGGWRNYPQFKNQGDCVSFVETGK